MATAVPGAFPGHMGMGATGTSNEEGAAEIVEVGKLSFYLFL